MYKVLLTASKERLVFNVDTGGLSPERAEKKVNDLIRKFRKDESLWFSKGENSCGTTVSQVGNYSEILVDADVYAESKENGNIQFIKGHTVVAEFANGYVIGVILVESN